MGQFGDLSPQGSVAVKIFFHRSEFGFSIDSW